MFLGVDILQQTIANMLLEKLPEFMDEENRLDIKFIYMNDNIRWREDMIFFCLSSESKFYLASKCIKRVRYLTCHKNSKLSSLNKDFGTNFYVQP